MQYTRGDWVSIKTGYSVPNLESVRIDGSGTRTGSAGIETGSKSENPVASGSNSRQ